MVGIHFCSQTFFWRQFQLFGPLESRKTEEPYKKIKIYKENQKESTGRKRQNILQQVLVKNQTVSQAGMVMGCSGFIIQDLSRK